MSDAEDKGLNSADNDSKDCDAEQSAELPLSKRALKRIRKKEEWLASRGERRVREREKRKRRIQAKKDRGEELGPSRKLLKKNPMVNSSCKLRVAFDCAFDDYMTEREVNSLVLQIQHAYAANRRATNPLQFYVTSTDEKTQARLDGVGDYKGWDINFRSNHYLEEFSKEQVIYLSSESPNTLDSVDDNKVYIIGGLVDHNNHKGLCHQKADKAGVHHARLPIGEFVNMQTRKVLACNHVFEILLRYTESKNWEQAFFQVIPKRKHAIEKLAGSSNSETKPAETVKPCKPESNSKPSESESDPNETRIDPSETEVKACQTETKTDSSVNGSSEKDEPTRKRGDSVEDVMDLHDQEDVVDLHDQEDIVIKQSSQALDAVDNLATEQDIT